jgi:hypothetical protein
MKGIERALELGTKCMYQSTLNDENRVSYWLQNVVGHGLVVPETAVLQLNLEQFKWLTGENFTRSSVDIFSSWIKEKLQESDFNTNRPLFLKTGVFSNKFVFSECKVDDVDDIGEKFLKIFYSGTILLVPPSSEIVVREYIHPQTNCQTIYSGMPLRTEFRTFYDFDRKKVMGCFNYWDRKVMQSNLKGRDLESFNLAVDELERDYSKNVGLVTDMVGESMSSVDMKGQWSIDIMKNGSNFYLIDMALAEKSYYYDQLVSKQKLLGKGENKSKRPLTRIDIETLTGILNGMFKDEEKPKPDNINCLPDGNS